MPKLEPMQPPPTRLGGRRARAGPILGPMERTALVTGANRGIGLEVCRALAARGLRVLLGARDETLGEEEARRLRAGGLPVRAVPLDVGRDASVAALAGRLARLRGV